MSKETKIEIKSLTIEGRNAVLEAFRSGKPVDKLFVLDGCQDGPVRTIVREAKKHDTILNFVSKERLDQLSETGKHQGVIAHAAAYEYSEIEDMFALAEKRGEDPFFILLDNIEDPHNLGAIIRTANLAGAHGDHSEAESSRTYSDGSENFGRGIELYSCGQGYKSCKDDGRVKRAWTLVCLCRHGRRVHVPDESDWSDRSCDWK